jgi:hypothetical protein
LDFDLICWLEALACVWPPAPILLESPRSVCEVTGLCFIDAPDQTAKVFGFAEFVQAFALLVVIYTVSDVRYRFRIRVAPLDIWFWTFVLTLIIGFGTLIADFWYGNHFPVPTFLKSQTYLQTLFGTLFIGMVMTWLWFGFIRPPTFSKRNAKRYAYVLYSYIVRGSNDELPQIAAELGYSAHSIVSLAHHPYKTAVLKAQNPELLSQPLPANFAREIMFLIADRKLCRAIIANAPGTAIAFFESITELKKYGLPLNQFAANVFTEALLNKDSIFYHEGNEFQSGLIGYTKPFSKALFGDFQIVDARLGGYPSPLDVDHRIVSKWDADQVEAYGRAVVLAVDSYLREGGWWEYSSALSRAFENIKRSLDGLGELDALTTSPYETDAYKRFSAGCDFATDVIKTLQKYEEKVQTTLRVRDRHRGPQQYDLTDAIAAFIEDIIFSSTAVRSPNFSTWGIQHNTAWRVYDSFHTPTHLSKIIQFKVRRLLYNEIARDGARLNFKSARLLGFCLYVLGLTLGDRKGFGSDSYALRKVILNWTVKYYTTVRRESPHVAEAVLIGRLAFADDPPRLIKTYEGMLGKKPDQEVLLLDPAPRAKRRKPAAKKPNPPADKDDKT